MEGEIYFIKNKTAGKGYVGQALKIVSSDKIKWGTEGRWKSHIWEAFSDSKKGSLALNNAIIKYGKNDFEVRKICDCYIGDMDILEKKYIVEYNTLAPHGYNLTEGGKNGKHSDETNIKKKIPKKDNEEYKQKISFVNIGKRFEKHVRKYPEDNDLPKYICCKRKKGVIIGYSVCSFPTGVNTTETITKLFKSKNDPLVGLQKALAYLEELNIKYAHIADQNIIKKEKLHHERLIKKKLHNFYKNLPPNISPIVYDNKLQGYEVKGLKDNSGKEIPKRVFTDNNSIWNLDQATKYINQVKILVEAKILTIDWNTLAIKKRVKTFDLPRHIRNVFYNGKLAGYRVNKIILIKDDKTEKNYSKSFTKKNMSLEEKYKLATEHLEFIKQNYKIKLV